MMRPVAWSAIVTGTAVLLFVTLERHAPDLRIAGAAGGALLAVIGVMWSGRPAGTHSPARGPALTSPMPRFFRERRTASRLSLGRRVRVSVDGHAYEATLLNVSSSGALLRLPPHIARRLRTEVGTPVRIENQPAGAVARVGAHGVYVDFAVAYTSPESGAGLDAASRT